MAVPTAPTRISSRPVSSKNQLTVPRIGSTSAAKITVEYTGRSALTVLSPATGKRYRFDRQGARIEADARDRLLLQSIPGLKLLRS